MPTGRIAHRHGIIILKQDLESIFMAGFDCQGVLLKYPSVWLDGAGPPPVSSIGPALA